MRARVVSIVRGKIAPKPVAATEQDNQPSPVVHARHVKAFVEEYTAIEALMASAQSRNRRDLQVELIDRKSALIKRVRFVEVAQ